MKISWTKSKKYLATLWFIGSGLIFLTLIIQTIMGRYVDNVNEVWKWFLPTIMPSLSLIIGVFVMDARGREEKIVTADRFFLRLSFGLSLLYLIVVSLTILLQPFSKLSPVELMKQSNLWLGPFQGLVSASLGAFFIKTK